MYDTGYKVRTVGFTPDRLKFAYAMFKKSIITKDDAAHVLGISMEKLEELFSKLEKSR